MQCCLIYKVEKINKLEVIDFIKSYLCLLGVDLRLTDVEVASIIEALEVDLVGTKGFSL